MAIGTGRRPSRLWTPIVVLALILPAIAAPPALAGTPTPGDVAERTRASVVTVYTWAEGGTFAPGRTGREPSGAGSGWVYADGVVVTNAHVVGGAERVGVVTSDGTTIPAEVAGADWYHDVAVLRLDPEDGHALPPAATAGDSDAVRAGDEVIAIGTPHGQFADTVTAGHVARTQVALNTGAGYSLTDLIQHDAPISPGNSGGPLVSMDGEVIGMNVARVDIPATERRAASDVSFAIASNTAVAVAEEILATGAFAHPYLGVQTRIAEDGVTVVAEVEAGSPAEAAGLAPGDVLVAVAGERVDADHLFIDLLYRHDPGEVVTFTVTRGGEAVEVPVTLGRGPAGVPG